MSAPQPPPLDSEEISLCLVVLCGQAVKRNAHSFPRDFPFQLSQEEWVVLRSQSVTLAAAVLASTESTFRGLSRSTGLSWRRRSSTVSRVKWPMHFGRLNHDTVWIFDEVKRFFGPPMSVLPL